MAMPDSAQPRPIPTSASYSITVRVYAVPDSAVVGRLATAVSEAGGLVTAVDVSESRHDRITIDVTCSAVNGEHAEQIVAALRALSGVEVHRVSDRTFLLHLGGKISVESKVPLRTRDDLSMAYTPGVGRVSLALAAHPEDVAKLTIKGNSVAVVTDGSAVLGLGNIGPGAALPVMEGKAALFKRFANIDAWPICLDTQDVDQIVADGAAASRPASAASTWRTSRRPRCFEIEARLRELLDIPVFHDDQHGTAIVVLAALTNALRCVRKGARLGAGGGVRRRRGRHRDRRPAAGRRRAARAGLGPGGHPVPDRRRRSTRPRRALAGRTNPERRHRRPARRAARRRRVHRGVARPACCRPSGSPTWPRIRWCSRWPTRTRRPTWTRPASTRRSWPPDARTTRTRSTTCWPFPGCSGACWTPRPARSPPRCCCGRPRRWRTASATASSTRPTSSRRCSTRRCRRRWPRRWSQRRQAGRPGARRPRHGVARTSEAGVGFSGDARPAGLPTGSQRRVRPSRSICRVCSTRELRVSSRLASATQRANSLRCDGASASNAAWAAGSRPSAWPAPAAARPRADRASSAITHVEHVCTDLDPEVGAQLLAEPEQVLPAHPADPGGDGVAVDGHPYRGGLAAAEGRDLLVGQHDRARRAARFERRA